MSAEIIAGLVGAIITISLFLSVFLNYQENQKRKKRVRNEWKSGSK